MKKKNECEICLNDYFKKQILKCHICKKEICYKCFLQITERLKNINENYKCSYCRTEINIYELGRIFHRLNKIKQLDNFLQINLRWTDTDYDSDSTNEDLNVEYYTNDDIELQRIINSSFSERTNEFEQTYFIQNPIINNENEEIIDNNESVIIEVVDLDIKIKCQPNSKPQTLSNHNTLINFGFL